jgi:hypothetical protein
VRREAAAASASVRRIDPPTQDEMSTVIMLFPQHDMCPARFSDSDPMSSRYKNDK